MCEASNISAVKMNSFVGSGEYLVTYSQADESKFSTRKCFQEMLEAEINADISAFKVKAKFELLDLL